MSNIEYLLSNASEFIQFRVKKEFLEDFDHNLYEKIRTNKIYYKRLDYLKSREKDHDFYGVHGATNEHLENAINNMMMIGIDIKDLEVKHAIDERIKIIRNRVVNENFCFDQFPEIILFPLLYKIGYRDTWLIEFLNQRLELLYHFCKNKNYQIYMDKSGLGNIPKCWKDDKVISPMYYDKGEFQFPLIYDIVYLHELYKTTDVITKQKIDTIIEYVITEDYYSKIQTTYGILIRNLNEEKPTRYMKMGWDCKIHGFYDFIGNEFDQRRLLNRIELFSIFDGFKKNPNFIKWLLYFEKHMTDFGTFILPEVFLKNNVLNKYGENIKKNNWIEIESTFIIQSIRRHL